MSIPKSTNGSEGALHAHVVPGRVLIQVWLALVALTVLTVAVTAVNLGGMNLWLALIIATVKASLVALYFMHLRYDEPFNAIVLLAALVFLALFVGLALLDTQQYRNDLIPGYAPAIENPAP